MAAVKDFDQVIEQCQRALEEFVKGNPEPMQEMFFHQEERRPESGRDGVQGTLGAQGPPPQPAMTWRNRTGAMLTVVRTQRNKRKAPMALL